jgi:hypothetical protein
MLLQTLPFFGNSWCQNCFLVKRYLKGCFHSKPPVPRYRFTWDVSVVLKYLMSLYPLNNLTLKMLTLKLVALIALATAPRAQTLVSMNVNNLYKEQQAVVFTFPKLLKTTKMGDAFVLKIDHYDKEELCVMHTVLHYLRVTKTIRKSSQFFISYKTFQPVSSSTIARWLKDVLTMSGVNSEIFKAHSYRSASTSAAFSRGCSLKNILDTADWKSDKNFRKFYLRKALTNENVSFSQAVLSSHVD